jgi:hypothetical protein
MSGVGWAWPGFWRMDAGFDGNKCRLFARERPQSRMVVWKAFSGAWGLGYVSLLVVSQRPSREDLADGGASLKGELDQGL